MIVALALVSLAGLAICAAFDLAAAAAGFLVAAIFWINIPLGALMLRLIAKLTGGERQPGVVAALTPGLSATPGIWLLAAPIVALAGTLYPWMRHAETPYLAPLAVAARTVAAMMIWTWMALRARGDFSKGFAALALGLHGLLLTVVGVDWILSLEPRWITSNIAMTLAAWQMLAGAACAMLAAPLHPAVVRDDFAGTLAGGGIGSIYFGYMSFFVAWYSDLVESTRWYRERIIEPWTWAPALAAVVGIGAIVTALGSKARRAAAIAALCALWIYICWWIAPAFGVAALAPALISTALIGAVGALTLRVMPLAAGARA